MIPILILFLWNFSIWSTASQNISWRFSMPRVSIWKATQSMLRCSHHFRSIDIHVSISMISIPNLDGSDAWNPERRMIIRVFLCDILEILMIWSSSEILSTEIVAHIAMSFSRNCVFFGPLPVIKSGIVPRRRDFSSSPSDDTSIRHHFCIAFFMQVLHWFTFATKWIAFLRVYVLRTFWKVSIFSSSCSGWVIPIHQISWDIISHISSSKYEMTSFLFIFF